MEAKIIEALSKYGWKGVVLGIILILLWNFLKSKYVIELWGKFTDKVVEIFLKNKVKELPSKVITESDITNHDIFNYIDFWMYSKVPTFQFSSEYRTFVFKRYLSIFLKCYKRDLSEFVNSKQYQTMDQSELWRSLLNIINKIVYDYERECEESGVPKIIIMKMKAKNNDTIQLTIDLIEGITNSQFYESEKNLLKMYSILNIILSILENLISSSESVCNSINGQIKGLWIMDGTRKITEP
jgi:hypothetical protein